MRKGLIALFLGMLLNIIPGLAQCITGPVYVTKRIGESVTVAWDYPAGQTVYKFRMRVAPNAVGKYPIFKDNITGVSRTVTFNVPFSVGTYYYFLEACNDVNCSKQTPGSNHVAITVTR
jgi:hypothetical protein